MNHMSTCCKALRVRFDFSESVTDDEHWHDLQQCAACTTYALRFDAERPRTLVGDFPHCYATLADFTVEGYGGVNNCGDDVSILHGLVSHFCLAARRAFALLRNYSCLHVNAECTATLSLDESYKYQFDESEKFLMSMLLAMSIMSREAKQELGATVGAKTSGAGNDVEVAKEYSFAALNRLFDKAIAQKAICMQAREAQS
jgi:hypothetical protein